MGNITIYYLTRAFFLSLLGLVALPRLYFSEWGSTDTDHRNPDMDE